MHKCGVLRSFGYLCISDFASQSGVSNLSSHMIIGKIALRVKRTEPSFLFTTTKLIRQHAALCDRHCNGFAAAACGRREWYCPSLQVLFHLFSGQKVGNGLTWPIFYAITWRSCLSRPKEGSRGSWEGSEKFCHCVTEIFFPKFRVRLATLGPGMGGSFHPQKHICTLTLQIITTWGPATSIFIFELLN
jgi:hypothetical protein